MPPLATLAMLSSSVLATCCTLADPFRPGRARTWTASFVMLAAMVDVALLGAVLPLVWAIAVVVTGVAATPVGNESSCRREAGMRAHRGLSAVAMSALLVGHSDSGAHAHSLLSAPMLVAVLCSAVAIGGAWLTAVGLRSPATVRRRIAILEPALMAAAISTMLWSSNS